MPKTKRPAKPQPGFPLFPHAAGVWAKKVRGKLHYFGPWRDPKAALEKWLAEKDDLLAGRTPRPKTDGVTLRDLANRYLTSKKALADNGELALRTYGSYFVSARNVLAALGKDRLLTDLAADDFVHLRKSLATTLGPVALGNEINRVRMLFKFAFDTMLIDRPVRFGPGFKKPSAKTIRIARAEAGPKMFEAQELRAILEAAPAHVRAMALLGINCGYGNSDCARLPTKALDLERGWIHYARPKTGVARKCPLWPETVAALQEALDSRPAPKDIKDAGLVFLTRRGTPWAKDTSKANPISVAFGRLLDTLGLHRPRLSFYTLRHVFETIAGDTRDQIAVDHIMGHSRGDMASAYRERIDDTRLVAVVEHVRKWLFGP